MEKTEQVDQLQTPDMGSHHTGGEKEASISSSQHVLCSMDPKKPDELKPDVSVIDPSHDQKPHSLEETGAPGPSIASSIHGENDSVRVTTARPPATDDGDRDTLDSPPNRPLNMESDSPSQSSLKPKSTVERTQDVATDARVNLQREAGLIENSTSDPRHHPSTVTGTGAALAASTALPSELPSSEEPTRGSSRISLEASIDLARQPLTKLYGKYLCKTTDRSLADARNRLKRAIEQTRTLRQSFTERVYTKYRIRLKPPKTTEEIIGDIQKDPGKLFHQLSQESDAMREEKEIEREETTRLNAEIAQTAPSDRASLFPNIDNAEQLMFLTSGLSLVILPEDESGTSSDTGQRTRSISSASALAAEVVLDRTRKAAAMRVERQRRIQLQLLRGETPEGDQAGSKLSDVPTVCPTHSKPVGEKNKTQSQTQSVSKPGLPQYHRPAPKTSKQKSASSASSSAFLNLNPTADEVKTTGKLKPATEALVARGVGPVAIKSMQVRLRHPHPNSLGGLRRANVAVPSGQTASLPDAQPTELPHSQTQKTLPPLPTTKDRLERKPLAIHEPSKQGSALLHRVLEPFVSEDTEKLVGVPKLSFLNQIRKLDHHERKRGKTDSASGFRDAQSHPMFVVSVLHSLGMVALNSEQVKTQEFDFSKLNPRNRALYSEEFKQILSDAKSKGEDTVVHQVRPQRGEKRHVDDSAESDTQDKKPRIAEPKSIVIPAASIRGGGEVLAGAVEQQAMAPDGDAPQSSGLGSGSNERGEGDNSNVKDCAPEHMKKRKRTSEARVQPGAATTNDSRVEGDKRPDTSVNHESTPSTIPQTFQFPNQVPVGRIHNTTAGDMATYLGGIADRRQLYEMQQQLAQGQIPSFGFPTANAGLMGYTANAQALVTREHQAAALLGSYGPGAFRPSSNNGSITGLLGSQAPSVTRPSKAMNLNESQEVSKGTGSSIPQSGQENETVVVQVEPLATGAEPSTTAIRDTKAAKVGNSEKQGKVHTSNKTSPPLDESTIVREILTGKFHMLPETSSQKSIDLLMSQAAKVPIPRALVAGPLKERMNTPGFKNVGKNGAPPVDRDVATAAILVWLWSSHEKSFRRAFETNGRFDVDPECKWLIQAAVDTSVSELSVEIANSVASGKGPFAEKLSVHKTAITAASNSLQGLQSVASTAAAKNKTSFCTASVVSRSLSAILVLDSGMNRSIPMQGQYVNLLDEARIGALRAKSRERVLLANLVARNTMVTENFTNAYASSLVRAGEALGHERLFEVAQDEELSVSTLAPHDIFSDDNGIWEDPCRPAMGFTEFLSGDDLLRRAHARAAIQKSLRKLQERYHIRGGTPDCGPFADPLNLGPDTSLGAVGDDRGASSPRGPKRRASSMAEQFSLPGTGFLEAKNVADYEPRHICAPLGWDPESQGNTPYGIHMQGRPLSIASLRPPALPLHIDPTQTQTSLLKSPGTAEIEWSQVASTFQSVEIPKKGIKQRAHSVHSHEDATVPLNGSIVAPFCRQFDETSTLPFSTDTESDDEDLTDSTVLANHQRVLDEMKGKLEAYLEARKKYQDKRKNRHSR